MKDDWCDWRAGSAGPSAEGPAVSAMEFVEAGFELGRLVGLCCGFLAGAGFAGFLACCL